LLARRAQPGHVFFGENYPHVLTDEADISKWRSFVLSAEQEADNEWDSLSDLVQPYKCRCAIVLKGSHLMYICSRFNYEFHHSQLLDTRERALAETMPDFEDWPDKMFESHSCFGDLESLLDGTPIGDESLDIGKREQLESWFHRVLNWSGHQHIPLQQLYQEKLQGPGSEWLRRINIPSGIL